MGRFTIDASDLSVVIVCTECQTWVELRATRAGAWEAAREHEIAAHPGSTQAATALWYAANAGVSKRAGIQ